MVLNIKCAKNKCKSPMLKLMGAYVFNILEGIVSKVDNNVKRGGCHLKSAIMERKLKEADQMGKRAHGVIPNTA